MWQTRQDTLLFTSSEHPPIQETFYHGRVQRNPTEALTMASLVIPMGGVVPQLVVGGSIGTAHRI